MENPFVARLLKAIAEKKSQCVVGLDPRADLLPRELAPPAGDAARPLAAKTAAAFTEFCVRIVDAVEPFAVAVKPQIAFFEQLGLPGLASYAAVVGYARKRGLLVIGDAKRGDIGSTAEAYAEAHLASGSAATELEVDALTVNPLFGTDGVRPFIDAAVRYGKGLFILVRTSNPSGAELQDLACDGTPVYERLGRAVEGWGETVREGARWSPVGAVVGATWPEQARRLRQCMPHTIFLVPGYGAQGGTADQIPAFCDAEGQGAIVNASRSVIFAWRQEPYKSRFGEARWTDAVRASAETMRAEIERGHGR